MKFSISDIVLFYIIFDICKQYSDNVKMYVSTSGLHIQTSDDANISIIDFKLNKSYFDSYECDTSFTIDFDLKDLCKILKICKKSITLTHFIFEDNVLVIILNTENIKKTFKINSIYTNYDLIDINNISINNRFEIDSNILRTVFNDFILFSNEITIKLNNSDLYFYSQDTSVDTIYKYNIENVNNTIDNNTIKGTFALDYLHKFKLFSDFKINTVKFDNDKPLFLSIENNINIEINFILAPKMT